MVARKYELSRFHFFFFLHTDLQLHNIPITSGTNTVETSCWVWRATKVVDIVLEILSDFWPQFYVSLVPSSHTPIGLKPICVKVIWNIFWFIKRAVLSLNHRVQNLISCGCELNFSTKKKNFEKERNIFLPWTQFQIPIWVGVSLC